MGHHLVGNATVVLQEVEVLGTRDLGHLLCNGLEKEKQGDNRQFIQLQYKLKGGWLGPQPKLRGKEGIVVEIGRVVAQGPQIATPLLKGHLSATRAIWRSSIILHIPGFQ